jgi:hypothetical protein
MRSTRTSLLAPLALSLAAMAALTALDAPAAAAQEGRSIYAAVDAGGRRVATGEEASGSISTADLLGSDGRIQVWVLWADPGEHVRVDLRSTAFDPYLRVVGPGFGSGLTDDDGGEGLNARLCFEVPAGGETRVVASALSDGTGAYRIAVAAVAEDACEATTEAQDPASLVATSLLAVGQTGEGTLSDSDTRLYGSLAQAWTLQGAQGTDVTLDLRSTDFDSYLTVLGPGLETLTDDDGGGRCDARLTFTFPETGDYRVVVSTLGDGTGSFTLSASEEPGPLTEGSCIPATTGGSTPESGAALDEVPILGQLSLEGGVDGALMGDERLFRGSPVQGWTVEGEGGQRLAITMTSEEMDSYLYFDGPGFDEPLSNDDGAGELNARICVQLPESGTFRAFPGRLSADGAGKAYRLEVTAAEAEALCDDFQLSEGMVTAALLSLDPQGRTIEPGQTVESELTDTDTKHPSNGTLVEAWRLVASPGSTVWIDMLSDAFDPVLRVLGPSLPEAESDDFSEGWNSRLEVTVPDDGIVLVVAGAFYSEGSGAFRLRVSTDPPPLEVNAGGGGGDASVGTRAAAGLLDDLVRDPGLVVPMGAEVEGRLTESDAVLSDGHRAQAWTFHGNAGDEVIFEAVSEDFDPVIYLEGPGVGNPLTDDDGGEGLNSRLVLQLPESGAFTVVVGSLEEKTGSFKIRVLRRVAAG